MVGNKTTVSYSPTAEGQFTKLADVTDTNIPEVSIEKVENTGYETDADDFRTYESGIWKDPGDIELTVNYEKTNAAAVYGQQGVQQFFKVTLKDGSGWSFPGFLSKIGGAAPNKELVTQKITIAATGKVEHFVGGPA